MDLCLSCPINKSAVLNKATCGIFGGFATPGLPQNVQRCVSLCRTEGGRDATHVLQRRFFCNCPPSHKSRRLGARAGRWWAQACIYGIARGFLSHSNIARSFAHQPLALRISLYKQQKHRRLLIKASVRLAFGASCTLSKICSRSTWHPSLPRGYHLELLFVVSMRS
jgi:hypothetical protein